MAQYDYNLIVIGGGTAGLITANVAAQANARVALIEAHKMGGDCLNTGCVPSKTLISSAKLAANIRRSAQFGLQVDGLSIDFAQVMQQVQEKIDFIAPIDSVERYTELGCECYQGKASITSPHQVEVNGQSLSAEHIVIATGGRPRIPDVPGLADLAPLHSDNFWQLRQQPKHLLVVGSGPIGCELAQAMQRLGSHVTLIDRGERLLSKEDPEVSQRITEVLRQEGMQLIFGAELEYFTATDSGGIVHYTQQGQSKSLTFDRVLVAAGRQPNTQQFNLTRLGVDTHPDGSIKVDAYMRTSQPSIWACGDAVGPYQFTHMAAHQAGYVAMNTLATPFKKFAVDYSQVPWVTYVDPEVARCGLNETEAQAQGIAYEVTQFDFEHQDRAITERDNHGMLKVLTVPKKDTILGVTICGPHAGELLAEFNLAIKNKLGLKAILNTIHPYPTFSEANRSVATLWRKKFIPYKLLALAKKYFTWRRNR